MAARITVKNQLILLLVKKIIFVKNTTAYTQDWYCHLVVDRASLSVCSSIYQSVRITVHLFIVCLFNYQFIIHTDEQRLFVRPFVGPSVYSLTVCLSVCLFVFLFICLSACPSSSICRCLSLPQFTYQSIQSMIQKYKRMKDSKQKKGN